VETRVRYQQLTEAVPLWNDSDSSLRGDKKWLLSRLEAEISFIPRWNESPPCALRRGSQLVTTRNHTKHLSTMRYFRRTPSEQGKAA
jgi:hypothetical protein